MASEMSEAGHTLIILWQYAIAYLSVRPSHGCISQKRLKLGIWNFRRVVAPSL